MDWTDRLVHMPVRELPDADVRREALSLQHDLLMLHDRLDALAARIARRSSLRDTVRDLAVTTDIVANRLRVDARIYPA